MCRGGTHRAFVALQVGRAIKTTCKHSDASIGLTKNRLDLEGSPMCTVLLTPAASRTIAAP